jgi:hypothetical protein
VHALDGCDSASLSLIAKDGPVTKAATDQLCRDGDQIQYDEGEGPAWTLRCTSAGSTPPTSQPTSAARAQPAGWPASWAWPAWWPAGSPWTAPPNHTLGGLNLYSTGTDAFSDEDQILAILLSSLGAGSPTPPTSRPICGAAIEYRTLIGEAIGILRAQSGMTRDQAFHALAQASSRMHIKFRELARRIADGELEHHTSDRHRSTLSDHRCTNVRT